LVVAVLFVTSWLGTTPPPRVFANTHTATEAGGYGSHAQHAPDHAGGELAGPRLEIVAGEYRALVAFASGESGPNSHPAEVHCG